MLSLIMDFFEKVEQTPPDPIFGLITAFNRDPRLSKVNLGAGIYKTGDLSSFILGSVKRAEERILEGEKSKDYLPIDGLAPYVDETMRLIFGKGSEKIYGAQTVGGTAALRVGSTFLHTLGHQEIYISDPSWANHKRIFEHAGLKVRTYPYFHPTKRGFDFEGCLAALSAMPPKSVVLLQGCCHNPTGFDPTSEQWEAICALMQERALFPFFDFAYQGFGESLDKDAAAIRHFVASGMQCAVAVSHSKNFGLYAERTGALYFVGENGDQATRVGGQIKTVIRGLYSNPPLHGGAIVATILQDTELKQMWMHELVSMRTRISEMRKALVAHLEEKSNRFDFLAEQNGMFSYTGLTGEQVKRMIADYGIYLPGDGRINVAGLNVENVAYVAEALSTIINHETVSL